MGANPPAALPEIVVYGRSTCQDTLLACDRLRFLGVPFRDVDVERDAAASRQVEDWNGGSRVTPTILLGSEERRLAEPSLDEVDRAVASLGYAVASPRSRAIEGAAASRSLPGRTLPLAGGGRATIADLRDRAQLALFFPHAPGCLACRSYAHALIALGGELEAVGARPLIVLPAELSEAADWLHGEAELPGESVLADAEGRWRRGVATAVGIDPKAPFLLLLDRYQAPRAVSEASEAGGLVAPRETIETFDWLARECADCTPGPLPGE